MLKQPKLHITGLYMLRRLSAAQATQKHTRASPFVCFCSATVFCLRETASRFPNRKQKTVSYSRNVKCHLPYGMLIKFG